jgi:L-ribulose-5-phosphate 4-epimerase
LSEVLASDAYWEHRQKLAILCRVVASWGYIGTFGHISIRVPETEHVLITPGAGSEKTLMRADQIYVYDLTGNVVDRPVGEFLTEPAEAAIHTRVHRDKPSLHCVAHLHSPHSTLLGLVNRPMVPAYNQAFHFHGGVPTFDDPRLVVNDEQAGELSNILGDHLACQMRGHGSVVVGETPEIGLLNVYTIEESAKFQIAAEPFGGVVPFPQNIMEAATRVRPAARIANLLWGYFERRTLASGVPL